MKHSKNYLKDLAKGCADIEIYKFVGKKHSIHTDNISDSGYSSIDELPDEVECDCQIMDEEDYNRTILANGGEKADFEGWYGDKNAKVLIVVLW